LNLMIFHQGADKEPGGEADGTDRKALDALGARIDRARGELAEPPRNRSNKYQTLSLAWRMVFELVLGVLIGGSIGYAFDWAFGTLPLMMLIFGGFGFAAGVKTMLASSREVNRQR